MNKKAAKDKSNAGGKAAKAPVQKTIALNKRAKHEYHLEQKIECGLALQGWELKAIRAGRANIGEAYAIVKDGELFLFGAQITPLISASSHMVAEAHRTRKLLLHRREIRRMIGAVERQGLTLVPLELYFKRGRAKVALALAKGKQAHDKREDLRRKDDEREMARALRSR